MLRRVARGARAWVVALGCVLVAVGCRNAGGRRSGGQGRPFEGRSIEIFVGSASKPALEELKKDFEAATGARVVAHYGGSGRMLSQLQLSGHGDVYFPGSSDYMDLAIERGVVDASSVRVVAYLVPALIVPKGNPKGIAGLEDLARPDVRVGLARPDAVCVGLYAVELLERAGLSERVRPRVTTYADSCVRTAQLVALGSVDAAIGWRVFAAWNPDMLEAVPLAPEQIARIGTLPVALTRTARDAELARAFIEWLAGPRGRAVFERHGYLVTLSQARAHAGASTPVGGRWNLPAKWKQ